MTSQLEFALLALGDAPLALLALHDLAPQLGSPGEWNTMRKMGGERGESALTGNSSRPSAS